MTKTPGRFSSRIALAALALAAVLPAHAVSAQCAADLNGDRTVNGADLALLLGAWGDCPGSCPADLDRSGIVSGGDLGQLLATWGPCPVAVPAWALLVEAQPDPAVVTDPAHRAEISATGLAWRVLDAATRIEMLLVPPGNFAMGCSMGSIAHECYDNEVPVHEVSLTGPFYLGRYEVTQAQWTARMGQNPSQYQSASELVPESQVPNRPVELLSWSDVQGFLDLTGMRLPTEAQWEYACRAGTSTPFHNGSTDDGSVVSIAWHSANSAVQTHPVGTKAPNGLGFHDMLGNAWEWVSDWYGPFDSSPQSDPGGPVTGIARVIRGGSADADTDFVRSSHRCYAPPTIVGGNYGFRVARDP